jgi:hypothetical protein
LTSHYICIWGRCRRRRGLKWPPNLFPRNSCHTLRVFSAEVISRRFLPIFAFQNGEMSVGQRGSGALEFFYLYWLW